MKRSGPRSSGARRKDRSRAPRSHGKAIYNGVIIERLKRMNGLPPRDLDWQSELFIWRYLGGRKQF